MGCKCNFASAWRIPGLPVSDRDNNRAVRRINGESKCRRGPYEGVVMRGEPLRLYAFHLF